MTAGKCGKQTLAGTPCNNPVGAGKTSCGASHTTGAPVDLMAALKASIAKASIAKDKGMPVATLDPFHTPPAAHALAAVQTRMGEVQVMAARTEALGRSSAGMTATQLADRNTRGKFIAADAVKTIQLWRKEDPVAPNDHPVSVIPVVEMAESKSARQLGETAAVYMRRAMRRTREAAHDTDPAQRADLLSSAQSYAQAAHQLYDFAAQDTAAIAAAGHKSTVGPPAEHRAQAAKAVRTAWTENGRHGGRHHAAAAAERLRQVHTHLGNALAGYDQPAKDAKPMLPPSASRADLLAGYKSHSKAIADALTADLGIDADADPKAYAKADALRIGIAHQHARQAITVLEAYVAHPDHIHSPHG